MLVKDKIKKNGIKQIKIAEKFGITKSTLSLLLKHEPLLAKINQYLKGSKK